MMSNEGIESSAQPIISGYDLDTPIPPCSWHSSLKKIYNGAIRAWGAKLSS
jgi:hypothetical protein